MLKHIQESGHKQCTCGGYHYPHRPGSTFCDHNPLSGAWRASRGGASDVEVLEIIARIQAPQPCPF